MPASKFDTNAALLYREGPENPRAFPRGYAAAIEMTNPLPKVLCSEFRNGRRQNRDPGKGLLSSDTSDTTPYCMAGPLEE